MDKHRAFLNHDTLAKVGRYKASMGTYDVEGCLFSVAVAYYPFKEALLFATFLRFFSQ